MRPKKSEKGFALPEVINPLTSRCLVINVPEDLRHFAAFWGNLQNLMYPNNWEGTPEEQQEVAAVWREVIASARQNWESGECIMPAMFRLNPTSGVIEYQPYGGTGWTSLGDACACPSVSPSPSYDPEVTNPVDQACNIATYLGQWLFDKAEDAGQEFEAAADTAAAIDAIFALFPPAYLVADQVTDMLAEFGEAGVAVLFAWLSTDRKEEHQEWLYCKLSQSSPPEMTNAIWEEYKEWSEDPLSLGAGLYQEFLNSLEYSAISDRARIGSYNSGNCAAFVCEEWEHVIPFFAPGYTWTLHNGNNLGGGDLATDPEQIGGGDLMSAYLDCVGLPPATYTGRGIRWKDFECGNNELAFGGWELGIFVKSGNGSMPGGHLLVSGCGTPEGQTTIDEPNPDIDRISYFGLSATRLDAGSFGTNSLIADGFVLKGTGVNPFA